MRKLRAISPTDRLPPQSLEAEQSTLGAMLIGRDAVARAIELLQPEDFYRDAHRYIFEVALRLFDRGDPVDLVSVVTELQNSGRLEDVGGAAYLQTLIEQTPYATNVEYYAKIVREKATLRRLLEVATRIADWCYDSEDADETLDRAEQEILTIAQSRVSHDFVPIKPLLRRAFDEADQKFHAKSAVVGLSTGFPDLDYMTAGFQKSDLIIIAGRPAMGKTSLATNIAQYAAIHERKPVGIFSLEMSKEQLVQGMLCAQARINLHRWRTGHFSQDDWQRLARAIDLLNEAPIFIDDTPAMTPIEMRAKARRLRAEYGLGLIIVDYLQLMRATGRYDSRVQEISEITRSLKSLARELDVPLIACAQLSRAVEQRHDKRPMLSDLRESGQIEADADVVLFIYRESYYQRGGDKEDLGEGQEQLDETEIIIGKQRNGPTGTIKLGFLRRYKLFVNLEEYRSGQWPSPS